MIPTTRLHSRRVKHQVTVEFVYKLEYEYGLVEDFHHPLGYYSVVWWKGSWYVIAHIGCAWDGATLYPDYAWMMVPSLVHDILLWLTGRGIIREIYNDVIDLELYLAIINGKEPIPWRQGGNSKIVRKIRASIVLRGVNTADTKAMTGKDIVDIEVGSYLA